MTYENILKALGTPAGGLTYEQQAKNYEVFSDLMKNGVDLQELVNKANAPKEPGMDESLFKVMESAVAEDSSVNEAKKKLTAIRSQVLDQICMRDARYTEAYKDYKDKVLKAYTEIKDTPKGK